MPNSLHDRHVQVIGYLKQGRFVEGIEAFHAENARAQENPNPPTGGRTKKAENEPTFSKKLTTYDGINVFTTTIDDHGDWNGMFFYEAVIIWLGSHRYGPRDYERSRCWALERGKDCGYPVLWKF